MREAKPWFRKSTKTWYVQLDGRQWKQIMAIVVGEFRDLLIVLRETGCRPQEARIFEAAYVRDDHIILAKVSLTRRMFRYPETVAISAELELPI
jgi:hypothetical protein